MMCVTEALMMKALLVKNFKKFSGINDSFFSMFAGLINIGFSLGSHIALFFLGSLGCDEILTGRAKPRQISLFYKVMIGTITAFSCFSLMAIGIKKFEAYQKDKKLVKDVNVMVSNAYRNDRRRSVNLGERNTAGTGIDNILVLNSNILSIPVPALNGEERATSAPPVLPTLDRHPKQKMINKRYNSPVVATLVLVFFTSLTTGSILAYIAVFNVNESTSDYIKSIWFGWVFSIFSRTLLPIWIITFHHTDFRTFIFNTLHDLWLNLCLQNNRVQPIF